MNCTNFLVNGIQYKIILYIQLLSYSFDYLSLNCRCQEKDLYRIYPWVHQYFNNLKSCDQIQMVRFPDVNPTDLPTDLEFSMVAGSYIEIYNEPGNCLNCFKN